LVFGPFAGHEDEAIELHRGADDGDPFEAFLEDDVDVAVGRDGVCVCNPPQVEPVGVNLVVRQQDDAVWEVDAEGAVCLLMKLAGNTLITTNADESRTPPLGHCRDEQAEVLLGQGHVGVKVILGEEIEGRA
jgi:hypothetical protein